MLSLFALFFLFAQHGSESMDVSGNDCQGDVAFESVDSVIRTLVETMHLQGVDGGFNCGVCAAQEFVTCPPKMGPPAKLVFF